MSIPVVGMGLSQPLLCWRGVATFPRAKSFKPTHRVGAARAHRLPHDQPRATHNRPPCWTTTGHGPSTGQRTPMLIIVHSHRTARASCASCPTTMPASAPLITRTAQRPSDPPCTGHAHHGPRHRTPGRGPAMPSAALAQPRAAQPTPAQSYVVVPVRNCARLISPATAQNSPTTEAGNTYYRT